MNTEISETEDSWFTCVVNSIRGVQYDYTQGPISKGIILLAVPMILEMLMESTFAVVDIFFVGRLGQEAIAAVGLTESMLTILYAIAIGLSMSVTATVARRIGEGKKKDAAQYAAQAIGLGIAMALMLGLVGFFGGGRLLALMGADAAVLEVGTPFARILLGTNVVIMLLFINNAVFRGAGDPALAMRSLWLANGINLVLDPCLIFGLGPFPELGLTGAAVATSLGRGIGVMYQFWHMRRGTGRIHLTPDTLTLHVTEMMQLIRISMGGIGQFLIATASWIVLMRIVSPFGSAALAGYTVALRILMFTILPAWGLSNAAATLTGQNLGAGNPKRAERSVWLTGAYNMVFMMVVACIMILIPGPLIRIFTQDPAVVAVGIQAMRILAYGYVGYAWGMVFMNAFNGSGDTMTPTRLNFVCFWLIEIPLALFLARKMGWGPAGVFWSVTIAEGILAILSGILFRRGRWKLKEV